MLTILVQTVSTLTFLNMSHVTTQPTKDSLNRIEFIPQNTTETPWNSPAPPKKGGCKKSTISDNEQTRLNLTAPWISPTISSDLPSKSLSSQTGDRHKFNQLLKTQTGSSYKCSGHTAHPLKSRTINEHGDNRSLNPHSTSYPQDHNLNHYRKEIFHTPQYQPTK